MSLDPASSIAGIISLAGLLGQSVSFLYQFCSNLKHLGDEVESTVHSIEKLRSLLQHIEKILSDDTARNLQPSGLLDDLEESIKMCAKDLETWFQAMETLSLIEGRSFKKCVRNLKAVADNGKFPKLRLRLAAHQQHFSTQLGLMNVNIGMGNARLQNIVHTTTSSMQLNQATFQRDTSDRLEAIYASVHGLQTLNAITMSNIDMSLRDLRRESAFQRAETVISLKSVEARCLTLEAKLASSIARTRRLRRSIPVNSSRRKATKSFGGAVGDEVVTYDQTTLRDELKPGHYLVQVVLLCLSPREQTRHPSKLLQEFLAIEDSAYERRDLSSKLAMAQQVQGLRLVSWLLQGNRSLPYRRYLAGQCTTSVLVRIRNMLSTYCIDQANYMMASGSIGDAIIGFIYRHPRGWMLDGVTSEPLSYQPMSYERMDYIWNEAPLSVRKSLQASYFAQVCLPRTIELQWQYALVRLQTYLSSRCTDIHQFAWDIAEGIGADLQYLRLQYDYKELSEVQVTLHLL
ncbi:hypothetical protein MMC13_002235 [Lambiella insularis]|nr:hypothetical protein [Lambiella insularis]